MAFTLEKVVPWGRTFDEYVRMFALTEDDLRLRVLGCGDGPASFNKGMNARGNPMVSIDPIYQWTAEQIQRRIDETYDEVMRQVRQNPDGFVWRAIPSPEELGRTRMAAMQDFLTDLERGKQEGRYRFEELPSLPFDEKAQEAFSDRGVRVSIEQVDYEFQRGGNQMMRIV